MIAQDVIDRSRFYLNDTDSDSFRWRDEELVPLVNDAVSQVVRIRPDALYDTSGALITVVPATGVGSTLSIDDKWNISCALFTASMALNKQAGQVYNEKKATALMTQFTALVRL